MADFSTRIHNSNTSPASVRVDITHFLGIHLTISSNGLRLAGTDLELSALLFPFYLLLSFFLLVILTLVTGTFYLIALFYLSINIIRLINKGTTQPRLCTDIHSRMYVCWCMYVCLCMLGTLLHFPCYFFLWVSGTERKLLKGKQFQLSALKTFPASSFSSRKTHTHSQHGLPHHFFKLFAVGHSIFSPGSLSLRYFRLRFFFV